MNSFVRGRFKPGYGMELVVSYRFGHRYNLVFATDTRCLLIDWVVLGHAAVAAVIGAVTVNAASKVAVTLNVGATVAAAVVTRGAG